MPAIPLWLRARRSLYVIFSFLLLSGVPLLIPALGNAVFAKASTANAGIQFSKQLRIGFQSGDDWEPSITADRYGHVYTMYKHYAVAGGQNCPGCDRHVLVQRSDDGGRTWNAPRMIAPGPNKGGQFDTQIVVDPVDGRTIWASFLQYTKSVIAVVKSTDFGQTWSPIQIVSTQPPGLDKDELAVRGNTVVVAYDDNYSTYASVTLDGGIHLSNSVRIASFVPGYPYLAQAGFGLLYGDYFSMAVDVNNKTQIAWGEAPSYAGPGTSGCRITSTTSKLHHYKALMGNTYRSFVVFLISGYPAV